MGITIKLGLKNIGRNRTRSFLTIIAVVFCSGGITLYSVMFEGSMDMFLRGFTSQTGHVRLLHPKLEKEERLGAGRYFLTNIPALQTQLNDLPGVTAVAPRISLGAFLTKDKKEDVQAHLLSSQSKLTLSEGALPTQHDQEVLIDASLAKRLKFEVGESIEIIPRQAGSTQRQNLFITGFVKDTSPTQTSAIYAHPQALQPFLKNSPAAPTASPLALSLVYSKQAPAQGTGIIPAAESQGIQLHKKIGAGKMLAPNGKQILLGKDLAERLEAKVGEKITLMGKKAEEGGISMMTLQIVGIFSLGNGAQDKMFYVNLPTAQYFLDIPDQATYLLLFGQGIWSSTAIAAAVKKRKLPPQVTVQRWQDTTFGATMLPLAQVMLFILGGLIVFIGGIGLLNTLMMSVLERKNEIGIMMALGLSPRHIGGIFLFEGVLFGVIGAVLGVLLAVIASIPLITKGLSFGSAASQLPIPIEESFKGALTPTGIIVGLLVGILSTVVGALWPSYKASQTDPIEALRKS